MTFIAENIAITPHNHVLGASPAKRLAAPPDVASDVLRLGYVRARRHAARKILHSAVQVLHSVVVLHLDAVLRGGDRALGGCDVVRRKCTTKQNEGKGKRVDDQEKWCKRENG